MIISFILLALAIIVEILDFKLFDDTGVQTSLFFLTVIPLGAVAYIRLYHLFYYLTVLKRNTAVLEEVTLEDTKFNKRFNVYSSNQVEARYLLTPAFMERFYNLKTAFSAKSIRCSFFEDKLMVAIETKKDLFELGDLFTSIKDPTNIFQFYRELTSILT